LSIFRKSGHRFSAENATKHKQLDRSPIHLKQRAV
jgi:hypothetical protein